jgi:hypothetical protein
MMLYFCNSRRGGLKNVPGKGKLRRLGIVFEIFGDSWLFHGSGPQKFFALQRRRRRI